MIQLEPSAADWATFQLTEHAKNLRRTAETIRRSGKNNIPLQNAAKYVAEAYERQARELDAAAKEINPGRK